MSAEHIYDLNANPNVRCANIIRKYASFSMSSPTVVRAMSKGEYLTQSSHPWEMVIHYGILVILKSGKDWYILTLASPIDMKCRVNPRGWLQSAFKKQH